MREKPFFLAMLLGFVLLASSFAWLHFADPREHWSQEQADKRSESGIELHGREHAIMEAKTDTERQAALEARRKTIQRYEQYAAGPQEALERHRRPAVWLRWSGTACLLVGGLGFLATRKQRG